MDWLFQLIQPPQSWLFQSLVLPALYRFGFMSWADSAMALEKHLMAA